MVLSTARRAATHAAGSPAASPTSAAVAAINAARSVVTAFAAPNTVNGWCAPTKPSVMQAIAANTAAAFGTNDAVVGTIAPIASAIAAVSARPASCAMSTRPNRGAVGSCQDITDLVAG